MILFEKCGLKIEQAGDEIIFSGRANINITDKETFGEIARSISKFEPPIFNPFKNIGKRSQEAMKISRLILLPERILRLVWRFRRVLMI